MAPQPHFQGEAYNRALDGARRLDAALNAILAGEYDPAWAMTDAEIRWAVARLLAASRRDFELAGVTAC